MGGGNTPEQLSTYCEAIVLTWPELSGTDIHNALRHGLKHVRWFGKLNVMAVAEFIREYQTAHPELKAWNPRV